MTICNLNYKEIGPFAQTLFMGCSITSISHNLGWGSEVSSCTLKLVKDISAHPSHPNFGSVNTFIETIVTNTTPSNLFDSINLDGTDMARTLQKGIAQQEKNIETERINKDIIENATNPQNQDTGKKCWNPHNLAAQPTPWLGPDPGFIGDNAFVGGRVFGVAGVPCYAKFDDIMFGGYISKWTYEGGTYSVELHGPGNLLKGVQLIVNEYYGSISTILNNTAGAFPGGNPIALPYSDTSINVFNSTIFQGNIPNMINIFGYLQNQGFSNALVSDYGINAAQIYDTLNILLNNEEGIQVNQFSPYGAIVGKSLLEYTNDGGAFIRAPQQTTISHAGVTLNLTQLGLLNHKLAIDNVFRPLFRLDLTQVPRPDPNIYLPLTNNISLDEFITFCCDGAGVEWNVDLIPDLSGSDFSARIVINTYNRNIQPPPKVLKNLVSTFNANDRVISFSAGEEYSDDKIRKVVIGGKQERLFQVMSHTLSKYRNIRVFDPATAQFTNVQNDLNDSYLSNGDSRNMVRFPQAGSTRAYDAANGLPYRTYGGAATAQSGNDFLSPETLGFSNTTVTKGSYNTSSPILKDPSAPTLPTPSWYSGSTSYPLSYDLISPYFGRSTNGSLRKVFYDRKMRQMQVNVSLEDIRSFFPVYDADLFAGYITFYENEIRAAISGFDSWISYVLEPVKIGFYIPSTRLIYNFIKKQYGSAIANNAVLQGVGILKTDSKMSALPVMPHTGNRMSFSNGIPHMEGLRSALQKLHQFISSNIGQHYGKDFLVRVPEIYRRVDTNGVAHYSYEVCDSAWEEPGNFLDDTMQIGSAPAMALAGDNGKIGPLLGYNASAEWDNTVFENLNSSDFGLLPLSPMGRTLLQMRSQFQSVTNNNNWYFPLVHDLPPEEAVLLPHTSYLTQGSLRPGFDTNAPSITDSFGKNVPDDKKYKLYMKANILEVLPENQTNKNIIFDNGVQYCVISAPSKVYYRSPDSLLKTLFEDLYASVSQGIEIPSEFNNSYQMRIPPMSPAQLLFLAAHHDHLLNSSAFPSTIGLNSEQHVPISARSAMPCFAAIPLKNNLATYGPWISHPGFIADTIFPNVSTSATIALTNNIVGGVEVEISDSYVPWEYGGMDNLDSAILSKLADNNKYQQTLEAGTLQLAGIMLRNTNIGSRLLNNYGPVCNSIQVEMGTDGYRTTYHFRTYSRKLGFFNKEQADNIQRFGRQSLANRKQIVDNIRGQLSRQVQMQDPSADRAGRLPKALNYSPVNILFGAAYPMLHKNSSIDNAYTQLSFRPDWHLRPIVPGSINSNPRDMIRQQTVTQLYDQQELDEIISSRPADYGSRSMMSLDGLLSPISFYPTPYGATYAITFYPRSKCPYCKGAGFYNYKTYANASSELREDNTATDTTTRSITASLLSDMTVCNFCTPDADVTKAKKKGARPNEITPPFLLASGTDAQIISDRDITFQYNSSIINTYTLNPMVMSATGSDFSCYMNKQRSDRCGHSIDVVAFGNIIGEPQDCLRASLSPTISKNYSDYDLNLISADPSRSNAFQNVRFFGLKGPLMLHSWGYDLEGYPVPNSSGEYKINAQGGLLVDSDGMPVYKNQNLQEDGTYSAPYKENTFYKSWAQLPSTWPVGPIDLRWDHGSQMWTIGANYKPVWVVIETDLIDEDPVRGTILESSYDNSPLPSGLRKLVFVKDTVGMFSAPRGAALYCRYDSQNGFYEPIYNRPLVTTGVINGASIATIYKAYTPSNLDLGDDVTEYSSTFDNPLELDADLGSIGLFTFLNGKWILQSVRT